MAQASITEGQAALERGDWTAAQSFFAEALAQEETPDALYGLARSTDWLGDYEAAIDLYERAFTGFRARGETRLPARIAGRELPFLYIAVHGNLAASNGWMERAGTLLEEAGDCPERGWVELTRSLATDDPEQKERHVRTAMEIAERFGDTDLAFDALGARGTCMVMRGQVAEGMRRLDEAVTAASSGEVRDGQTVGEIYCKMLLCCELALDVRRAQQWMAVAEAFARRSNYLPVSAICRMYYGGILTAAGRWTEAEIQLTMSAQIYTGAYPAMRSGAVVRLADLRVRQGRLDEAAQLLAGYEWDSYAVQPLARLHLARGETEVATTLLRRFLDRVGEHVLHAPVLALLAEIEVAAGRLEEARSVCARLGMMADRAQRPHMRALAEYTAGLACASAGEPTALGHLEQALAAFASAGLPLEEARTRLAIARTVAATEPEVARAEARAALTAFEQMTAAPDADAAASLLRNLGSPGRAWPRIGGTLTKRESEVLRLVAEGLSNEQIAQRLYISKRTVEHHVGSILGKLGLSTRAEALAYAVRRG